MANQLTHFLLHFQDIEVVAQPGATHWQPRADISETPDAVHIEVEVAGLDQSDLRLHFEPGRLLVEGRRERRPLGSSRRCLQVEINYGSFRRVFPLPPDADDAGIEATYDAGLLVITIPRKKPNPTLVRVNIA